MFVAHSLGGIVVKQVTYDYRIIKNMLVTLSVIGTLPSAYRKPIPKHLREHYWYCVSGHSTSRERESQLWISSCECCYRCNEHTKTPFD